MNHEQLQRVAELYGVDSGYWDIQGHWHPLADEHQFTILQQITQLQTLDEMELLAWQTPLPPTLTAAEHQPLCFNLTLPHTLWGEPLQWHFSSESGENIEGVLPPAEATAINEQIIHDTLYQSYPIELSLPLTLGYHTLTIKQSAHSTQKTLLAESMVIVAPASGWSLEQKRAWGIQIHLYTLRSDNNEGIGDLTDLSGVVHLAQQAGAHLVGVNPLHALFPEYPEQASPYYPSSRKALNPLYLRVASFPEFSETSKQAGKLRTAYFSKKTQHTLEQLRSGDWVDYSGVAAFKWPQFRALFTLLQHGEQSRLKQFNQFYDELSQHQHPLWRYALYCALAEVYGSAEWKTWPAELQFYHSEAVQRFSGKYRDKIAFHLFLQWECHQQLERSASGMLYLDLATGSSPQGADSWMDREYYAEDIEFGAPPDQFAPEGQCWSMSPFNPLTLREHHYHPFIEMVRSNMQYARALRIDHVMSLTRLYWMNAGLNATNGTYVHYPQQELFAILKLESQRNQCMIIGEDLGTVPEGFSEEINQIHFLSYQLFWFQRYPSGLYIRPELWKEVALATLSSHDLHTFAGFWKNAPAEEREVLLAALTDQQLWRDEPGDSQDSPQQLLAIMVALQTFIARTPARLMMVNLDDLLLEPLPINQPGTPDQRPNWRRRIATALELLSQQPGWIKATEALQAERAN